MEKIKNILRPGHNKDDETMYGEGNTVSSAGAHNTTGTTESGTHEQQQHHQHQHQHHANEEGTNPPGIARQVFNPNGDKYSEAAYGPAGSTSAKDELPPSVGANQHLYTDPQQERKEHGVLRQILNPGGNKYDAAAFGANASTEPPQQDLYSSPAAEKEGGVLRQVLNPGGAKYDEVAYGTTATSDPAALEGDLSSHSATGGHSVTTPAVIGSSAHSGSLDPKTNPTTLSDRPLRPAMPGSFPTDASFVAATEPAAATPSVITEHQQQPPLISSGQGALAGGVGAASSSEAEGLTQHQYNQYYDPQHGLQSSSTALHGTDTKEVSGRQTEPLSTSATSSTTGPTARALATEEASQGGLSHHVYNQYGNKPTNASPLGSAVTAGTIGASAIGAHEASTHPGSGATTGLGDVSGLNSSRRIEGELPTIPATGGKFLGDEGSNVGGNASGLSGERSFPLSGGSTTASATGPGSDTHLADRTRNHGGLDDGRAGLAGAAGAASAASATSSGLGSGYGSGLSHEHSGRGHNYTGPAMGEENAPVKALDAVRGPHTTMAGNLLDPNVHGHGTSGDTMRSATTVPTGTTDSHHLGRDAVAVGGVGSAGLAATEAARHHQGDSTGPAPNTIGPHKSDVMNVLDPRVLPDPSKMHTSRPDATGPAPNTIGPHDKDYKNILDPRVTPAMSSQNREHAPPSATAAGASSELGRDATAESHLGRNVAVGGAGVGAAGLAARQAYTHDPSSTSTGATGATGISQGYDDHVSSPSAGARDAATVAYGQPSLKSPAEAASAGNAGESHQQHHFGRDAAVAGAGVGATGLGAHELSMHHDHDAGNVSRGAHDPATHHGGHRHGEDRHARDHENTNRQTPAMFSTGVKDAAAATGGATIGTASGQTATIPSSDESATTTGRQMGIGSNEHHHHHAGRNAAITGTAAAGAGAYGAGIVSQEHRHMEELAAQQPTAGHHQTGEYNDSYGVHTSPHGHEDEHHREKKQGFISKLLHRNKDKDSTSSSSHQTDDPETASDRFAEDHKMQERSRIGAADHAVVTPAQDNLLGGNVAGDAGRVEYPQGRNRLHKDPPTH